jgi:hypothetical protein
MPMPFYQLVLPPAKEELGSEPFFLQHHAGFLKTRAPVFTFLPTSRGQDAGVTNVGTSPKESVRAPDQVTVSQQQARGVVPSSQFCNLSIKELYLRPKCNTTNFFIFSF